MHSRMCPGCSRSIGSVLLCIEAIIGHWMLLAACRAPLARAPLSNDRLSTQYRMHIGYIACVPGETMAHGYVVN